VNVSTKPRNITEILRVNLAILLYHQPMHFARRTVLVIIGLLLPSLLRASVVLCVVSVNTLIPSAPGATSVNDFEIGAGEHGDEVGQSQRCLAGGGK
jgi:hypothetical protein